MANRGVWESGWWLGPTVSMAHTTDDVDRYVELFATFLDGGGVTTGEGRRAQHSRRRQNHPNRFRSTQAWNVEPQPEHR